jgi:hypothetical protein|tara:strand:- start:142 stop:603 length:462 start_codon:yes stop_codon:yes gene_type:complete
MTKYFLSIFFSLFFFNQSLAKDININENIDIEFKCELEKKIIKNSKYNYQTFLAKDLNEKGLDKFEIQSKKPESLLIKGLSLFLSESAKLNVKIVNKDVVLFKSIDQKNNYSESGIITRKTGELIHEITKNIKSENSEKYISIYSCVKYDKKV